MNELSGVLFLKVNPAFYRLFRQSFAMAKYTNSLAWQTHTASRISSQRMQPHRPLALELPLAYQQQTPQRLHFTCRPNYGNSHSNPRPSRGCKNGISDSSPGGRLHSYLLEHKDRTGSDNDTGGMHDDKNGSRLPPLPSWATQGTGFGGEWVWYKCGSKLLGRRLFGRHLPK